MQSPHGTGALALCADQGTGQATVDDSAPTLVYDGGCLFCSRFACLSQTSGGLPGLVIRDGRADHDLHQSLEQQGLPLRDGAVVIAGDQLLHGAQAIQWLCSRMVPSATLLRLLAPLMASPQRAQRLYPLLLLARRAALALRGLPLEPAMPCPDVPMARPEA